MSDSKYGKGFAFRMTILLGLLALVAAGFYYDRFVLSPQTEKTINSAYSLMTKEGEVSKKEVAEKIGFAASSTDTQDGYEIETYEFKRVLPFIKGQYLSVIYENGLLINILQNKPYALDAAKEKIEFTGPGEGYTGNYPAVAGGGPPPDASGDDEEDEEEGDDEDKADDDEGNEEGDDDGGGDDDGDGN